MALQNFIDQVGPPIGATWLNQVDAQSTTVFDAAITKPTVRTALTSDAPLEVGNGGTGSRVAPTTEQYFGVDTGAVNAYTVAAPEGQFTFGLNTGVLLRFTALHTNTGPATLNAGGLGNIGILAQNGVACVGGEILSTGPTWVQYTGSAWQVVGTGATPDKVRTPAEIAAGVTPTNYAYIPGDARRYGADPTGVADSTAALQNMIGVCESDTAGAGIEAYLPGGVFKRTATLNFTKRYIRLRGAGKDVATIQSAGVAGAVFNLVLPASGYWQPTIGDFSVIADATAGRCFDVSALTGGVDEMYDFDFHNLYTYTGGEAIYCTNAFSGTFRNWNAASINSHAFMVACGPSVIWTSCYAIQCAASKAGYRLLGQICLIGCNGLNAGDYWGVFGQDTTAADGFQSDFPGITDYPVVNLLNCNVEAFAQLTTTAYGILLHNQYKHFSFDGGKFERDLATNYGGFVRSRLGAFTSGAAARFNVGSIFAGTGAAKGPTGALAGGGEFYCDSQMMFEDTNGTLGKNGYHDYYSGTYAATVPILTVAAANDVYGDTAQAPNAITPRRLTVQMIRYATAALAPVGAAQAIDVTGVTKVIVTPAAAASISSATFTQTIGAGLDYKRNGDLIIEAGNANLTINHSAAGGYTFYLTGGVALALGAGKIARFLFSETSGQWVQV